MAHLPDVPEPARFGYPVFVDLHDLNVLVVGAGPVGARKAAALADAGALVRVVATQVGAALDRRRCAEVCERPFEPDDLDGVRLVITATGDPVVDAAVSAVARAQGIWVNAADQPVDCDFILPAIARAGRVSVAVSTDGASPALAKALRDRFATVLTGEVAALAEELAAARAAVRASGGSTEQVDWSAMILRVLGGDETG